MHSFSQLLVIRVQTYFKEKYGLVISDETAQEYLKSYAVMFAIFAESGSGKSSASPVKRTDEDDHSASDDLINNSLNN